MSDILNSIHSQNDWLGPRLSALMYQNNPILIYFCKSARPHVEIMSVNIIQTQHINMYEAIKNIGDIQEYMRDK